MKEEIVNISSFFKIIVDRLLYIFFLVLDLLKHIQVLLNNYKKII